MIIDVKDYDLVITCKNGYVHIYELGKETRGVQELKFEANIDTLPKISLKKVLTNEKGEIYVTKENKEVGDKNEK